MNSYFVAIILIFLPVSCARLHSKEKKKNVLMGMYGVCNVVVQYFFVLFCSVSEQKTGSDPFEFCTENWLNSFVVSFPRSLFIIWTFQFI